MQCRFCLEIDDDPMIAPCRCTGSVRHIHTACLHRWIRQGDEIIEDRLICTICRYPLFDLDAIPSRDSPIYIPLYNVATVCVAFHYLFLIAGIHSSLPPIYYFRCAQMLIYLIYTLLFTKHIRTKHVNLYLDITIQKGAFRYFILQIYFLYSFLAEDSVLMALASNMAIGIHWNIHVQTLQEINSRLLKN
jgi:hypothetical protein